MDDRVSKRHWLPRLGFIALAAIFSMVYYGGLITRLPFGIHDWAQADRLSLAINFYDHGMNFFKPATHELSSINGIVGVEFPIQAYLAAALGLLFGREAIPACFRVLDILIAISGLYALFLIVFKRTGDFIFSIFTPLFFFCCPVYVVYSGNFLPDPASVSVCFIAFYFLFNYLDRRTVRNLYAAMALLTIAVLIKTSAVTYFAGVALLGLWQMWALLRQASIRPFWRLFFFSGLMFGLILANLAYMRYLDETYHSTLFLAKTNPFKTWSEFTDYVDIGLKELWLPEYMLQQQYVVYLLIVVCGLVISFRNPGRRPVVFLGCFFLLAACTLAYLLGGQLLGHDYYILALFFPLLAFLMAEAMLAIRRVLPDGIKTPLRAGLFTATAFLFFFADHHIYKRQTLTGRYEAGHFPYRWLQGGERALDSLGIPKDKTIVAAEDAPNLGLLYCNRKGYHLPLDWVRIDLVNVRHAVKQWHTDILVSNATIINEIRARDSTELKDFKVLSSRDGLAILQYTGK